MDNFLKDLQHGLARAGNLRWLRPVYPDDSFSLQHPIIESRPMRKRPETGLVRSAWDMFNQDGEKVLEMEGWGMFRRRIPPRRRNRTA